VPIQVAGLALLFPQESGSLAMLAAIRRASSRVRSLAEMSASPPKAEIVKHCVCLSEHRLTIFCRTKQLNYRQRRRFLPRRSLTS
jgi:hypothetical protein